MSSRMAGSWLSRRSRIAAMAWAASAATLESSSVAVGRLAPSDASGSRT
jgi:hypothetical protein